MADANVVDLFKLSKHFYLFGKFLSQLDHRESYEVRKVLTRVITRKINKTKSIIFYFVFE